MGADVSREVEYVSREVNGGEADENLATLVDEVKNEVVPDTLTVDAAIERANDGVSEEDVDKPDVDFLEDPNVNVNEDEDSVFIAVYDVLEL